MPSEILESAWETYLRQKKYHQKKSERPYTSLLSQKERDKLAHPEPRFVEIVELYAELHARLFWNLLYGLSCRHQELNPEERLALVALHFHTYVCGHCIFWEKIFSIGAHFLRLRFPKIDDEEIWNVMSTHGYKTMQAVRKKYPCGERSLLTYPIPSIFTEEAPTKQKM